MVDTHCHLGLCKAPDAELVAEAAQRRGAADAHRRHRRGRQRARRSRPPSATRRFSRASGATRTARSGFDDAAADRLEQLAATPAGRGGRRDRARLLPRPRPARGPAAGLSAPRSRSPAGSSKPLVIHVRDSAPDDRRRGARARRFELLAAEATGVTVVLHCFSAPGGARAGGGRAGLVLLVRGQRHLPERGRAARGRGRGARRAAAGRDRRAVPRPAAACAASPTSRPTWSPPPRPSPRCAGSPTHELEPIVEANAARVFGW